MAFWVTQSLNALSFGMLLFIFAVGFSISFGLMRVANLAHGSFYMVGGYMAVTVALHTGNFLLGLIAGTALAAILGIFVQLLLRRLPAQSLAQVVITFGFIFIFADLCLWIWGGYPRPIVMPAFFQGSIHLGAIVFPSYRLFVIGIGLAVAIFLALFLQKTKLGVVVRAAVDDAQMLQGLRVNVPLVMTLMFGLGAGLAGFAGTIGQPFTAARPGVDIDVLLLALVVVIIGGVGSLRGALVGAVLVAVLDNFTKVLLPELSIFSIFAPLVIILIFRPQGLFAGGGV